MEYKDYYKILGVDKNADEKEIKKAYRRLARQYHPDVNPGDKAAEARFKEINEANEVLSDPEKRRKYDALGQDYQRWQQTGGASGFDLSQWAAGGGAGRHTVCRTATSTISSADDPGFSDFFEPIFGGMAGRGPRRARGPGEPPRRRATSSRGRDDPGRGLSRRATPHGGGRPAAGSQDPGGCQDRLQGADGRRRAAVRRGGPRGDIYLIIKVLPHPTFERRGDDLHCEVPVDLFAALLGGEVRVPTLTGPVALRIPAGTQSGRTFRLAGQGMPKLRAPTEHGDLLAKVRIMLPDKLTDREQELVREWAKLRGVAAS